jgi:hypothetical protein
VESSTRLGRHRWKVERSLAWLLANRRLTVRYERRADLLTAFLHLACALVCLKETNQPTASRPVDSWRWIGPGAGWLTAGWPGSGSS